MPRDYAALPPAKVTRVDRAVDDEGWIKKTLRRAPMGYLATLRGDQPFINSNMFVYDEDAHAIFMHTAKVGRTRANIEDSPRVCFTVTTMGRLFSAPRAFDFGVEYSGVVVFGVARVLESMADKSAFFEKFLAKYAPHLQAGKDYVPPTASEMDRTTVYQIDIESWSAKNREVAADFPGAYRYEDILAKE